jgi:hypothetical protein
MNIELRNLKSMKSLSEETLAFSASVYVNGEKFAEASNRGCGGETEIYPFGTARVTLKEVEAFVKANYSWTSMFGEREVIPYSLESLAHQWACEMTDAKVLKNAVVRAMKTKTVFATEEEKGTGGYRYYGSTNAVAIEPIARKKYGEGVMFAHIDLEAFLAYIKVEAK